MRITDYPRDKLPICCQLRRDWFVKVEEGEKLNEPWHEHREKVGGEYYRHFQALIIGNYLFENMGKKTCLECLWFRHEAIDYYDKLHKGNFKDKKKAKVNHD